MGQTNNYEWMPLALPRYFRGQCLCVFLFTHGLFHGRYSPWIEWQWEFQWKCMEDTLLWPWIIMGCLYHPLSSLSCSVVTTEHGVIKGRKLALFLTASSELQPYLLVKNWGQPYTVGYTHSLLLWSDRMGHFCLGILMRSLSAIGRSFVTWRFDRGPRICCKWLTHEAATWCGLLVGGSGSSIQRPLHRDLWRA